MPSAPEPKKSGRGGLRREIDYRCTVCGKQTDRDKLVAKKILYTTMGKGFRTLRARVVAWLCDDCLQKEEAYNSTAIDAAPGSADFVNKENPDAPTTP